MNAMTEFKFHTHAVRVFPTDDGTSFVAVAADVASVLGYGKTADFVRNIPERHKGAQKVRTLGGWQEMAVIDEPGLYYGVLRSNKPEAEPFVEWVTEKVLPSIRRTGGYVHPAATDSAAAQLALAQENGLLRDQLRNREAIIQAKDQAIMGLQSRLIGSQDGQIKLLKKVSSLEKRHAASEAKELVILLASQGVPREEIKARTGKTFNHIRQIIFQARLAGRLPRAADEQLDLPLTH